MNTENRPMINLATTGELLKSGQFQIFDDIENGIVIVQDVPGHFPIVYANEQFCKVVGNFKNPATTGRQEDLIQFVSPSDTEKFTSSLSALNYLPATKETYRLVDKDGNLWWQLASHRMTNICGKDYILISFTSIQELMGIQHELNQVNTQWAKAVNSLPVGLFIFRLKDNQVNTIAINDVLVKFANEIGTSLDGHHRDWSEAEMMVILNQNVYAFTLEEHVPIVSNMLQTAKKEGMASCVFLLRGSTKEHPIWVRSACSCTVDEDGNDIYYVTYSNATREIKSVEELRESHERMRLLSFYDPLTKVHSRNAYNELLEYAKTHPAANVGFVFSDVNGLKNMNDTYGHRFGDRMIRTFADILRQEFNNDDIYRISGDEFVVIVPDISHADFTGKVARIRKLTQKENDIASIGYRWEETPKRLKDSIDVTEQLMYVEKQQYYASKQDRDSKHHKEAVNQFAQDLADGLFTMYLQPKSNIEDSTVIGAEALVRKHDHTGKLVYPDHFIPMLEKEKLIPQLDYFMLEEVCKTLNRWKSESKPRIKISVNMSRITLAENNFLERIMEICNKYDVDRSLLEYEVTESNATMDSHRLREEIAFIKDAGFSVSLDDMGSEYSSLEMLLVEGIDIVKIDKSLIDQMTTFRGKIALKFTISMCHSMGLKCIAEGVEQDEQRIELMEMGCDMYQGYLLSRPIPVEEFEKMLD